MCYWLTNCLDMVQSSLLQVRRWISPSRCQAAGTQLVTPGVRENTGSWRCRPENPWWSWKPRRHHIRDRRNEMLRCFSCRLCPLKKDVPRRWSLTVSLYILWLRSLKIGYNNTSRTLGAELYARKLSFPPQPQPQNTSPHAYTQYY